MPPEQLRDGSSKYLPTSLDYINLPNPIQPAPQSQRRHPLNGTPRLESTRIDNASQIEFILDPSVERAGKRQKTLDSHLDLPKLPVRSGTKRMRIPPTLSGLHQPPPDAGLLPSINTAKPQVPPPRADVISKPVDRPKETASTSQPKPAAPLGAVNDAKLSAATGSALQLDRLAKKRPKRNKWTEEETECLLKGVARFGIGSWTKIRACPDYKFNNRTALDLKDRFRVCCPDEYTKPKAASAETAPAVEELASGSYQKLKGPSSERVSPTTLRKLGIDRPFAKSSRRSRHYYSAEEDAALLRGFKKHGNSWASIRDDGALGLSARQPTDLRDRMRTRYPEEYAKAGLALPSEKPPVADDHTKGAATLVTLSDEASATTHEREAPLQRDMAEKSLETKRPTQPSLFTLDDLFLGRPFGENDDDDGENEPIVLDRGILDWAQSDSNRAVQAETNKTQGINPMMTLNLPKPLPPMQAPLLASAHANTATALPSVASLLPENAISDHFELPSLMHGFGPLELEPKAGNTFPTLEELLSQPLD